MMDGILGGHNSMDFLDKYNAIVGAAIMVASAILGVYWYLFAGYLVFQILDYITGWVKASKLHEESSRVGLHGILKKVGYWIIVLVAFMVPDMLIHLGRDTLGINLDFLMLFGWFTLATLTINEARSILENLVECNVEVPEFLIKGLAVTEKLIRKQAGAGIPEGEKEE
jgi:toxin secretion/phage lysis holin